MIDSYRTGAKSEIVLDGHASFNGTNMAGKTSLLCLMPLFYGESPNKMVRGGGVTDSFITHYLPRTTSSIIFEYDRRGVPCMVVISASKSGESVCYRFIDKGFDLERFVDADGELVSGSDLNRHITKRGEFCSEQITVLTDYRSIIQNTVRKKEHRVLAGKFSFVGASSRLGHIEKIVTGMFSRAIRFHDIKLMIASCIMDEGQGIRLESSKSAMESWAKEYRAYQAVMAHSGQMKTLNESALRHETASTQLKGVHTEFLLLKRQNEGEIKDADARMAELDSKIRVLDEQTGLALHAIGAKQGKAEGAAGIIQEKIDALDVRHLNYSKDKIEDLARLVESIPQLTARTATLKERQEALLGKSSELVSRYASLKNERTAAFHAEERARNDQKEPVRAQAGRDLDRVAKASGERWDVVEAAHDQHERVLDDRKDAVMLELGELRLAARSPQPGQKHVEALSAAQSALLQATQSHMDATAAYDKSEQEHSLESVEFDETDKKIQGLHSQKAAEIARREHLLSLSNAAPGTLLHFLREYRPEWTADIARVVPEELLLRDDLAPSLTGSSELSLYGVSVELAAIDAPRASDEDVLRGQIEESGHAIDRIQSEIKIKDRELAEQSERLSTVAEKSSALNRARIQAELHESACKTGLSTAQRELDADRKDAGSKARTELAEKEAALVTVKHMLAENKAGKAAKKVSHDASLATEVRAINEKMSGALAEIDTAIAQAKATHDQDIQKHDEELERALKSEGVDTASLEGINAEKRDTDASLAKAHSGDASVKTWRIWVADEWSRREELVVAHGEAKTEVKRLAHERVEMEQARTTQNKGFIFEHDAAQKMRSDAEQSLSFIANRCNLLRDWPADMNQVENGPAPNKSREAMQAEMDRALVEIKSESNRAKREVDAILRSMHEMPGTAPYNFYDKTRLALGPTQEHGAPFQWVAPLREWFDVAHIDARRLLLSQCRTFSQGVHDFHERLAKFSKNVGTFSTSLKDEMNESINFRSISSIAIRLTTSFDNVSGWKHIAGLDAQYTKWAGTESNELPPDDFAAAVEQMNTFLQGHHSVDVKLEDLIDIEIDVGVTGQKMKTVKDEVQLKAVSSNGVSYLILCMVFVGLLRKIRGKEKIKLVWALDELRDLDHGNVKVLLEFLEKNDIHLLSAFPDPDPDILSLFKHQYAIKDGRKIATFKMPEGVSHV